MFDFAKKWLAEQPRPIFLLINVLDPHEPYEPPEPFDTRYTAKRPELGGMFSDLLRARGGAVTAEETAHFRAEYDGEIAYTDQALGAFLDSLRSQNRYADALIVVTSDHGELIGEHGLASHGVAPYEELVHVPLLVKYPGRRGGGRRADPRVSTLGVFATILRAAGVPMPAGVQSRPLDDPHPVFVEDIDEYGSLIRVAYEGPIKLVSSTDPAGISGFAFDPMPIQRALPGPIDAEALRGALADFSNAPRPANAAPVPVIDAERERKLRELGYVR
jgi:hypothetical protein